MRLSRMPEVQVGYVFDANVVLGSFLLIMAMSLTGCSSESGQAENHRQEDSLLTLVQQQTFQYFWENAEPTSGLAPERTHMDGVYPENDKHIVTTGGSGFGLMAILVGIDRGFISREQGFERFSKIAGYLKKADRFHGAWPHWMNGPTGQVQPFGKKDNGGDLVESAFLAQGLITVREYFKGGKPEEQALAARIDTLLNQIEWNWYTNGQDVLYWHWSPEYQWEMDFPVGGYNECLVMYVLAAGSPTHPISPEAYHMGWARNDSIRSDRVSYGLETVLDHYEHDDKAVGPLFWAHYSYLGLDPRHLKDRYADYWRLNRNHALIHYRHALANPGKFKGYGPDCWGLTSGYSMGFYAAHQPEEDLGVISPTAALSSFPYTPEESLAFLKFLYAPERDSLIGKYGPYDGFNLTTGWYVPRYLAIDQGPIPVMIENYRTGLLWRLFMGAPEVKRGLERLGFNR